MINDNWLIDCLQDSRIRDAEERARRAQRRGSEASVDSSRNRKDAEFHLLLTYALIRRLMDKRLITQEELMETFSELDGADGKDDCRVPVDVVKNAMGIRRRANKRNRSTRPPKKIRVRR